jgi:hypothetical protein
LNSSGVSCPRAKTQPGNMKVACIALLVLVAELSGCADDSPTAVTTPSPTAAPTAPPTASPSATPEPAASPTGTPTPTPSPTTSPRPIIYRLGSESTILRSTENGGTVSAPLPLAGTFEVASTDGSLPNELFSLKISALSFSSSLAAVTGVAARGIGCGETDTMGCIVALTFEYPRRAYGQASVDVGGDTVIVVGTGPVDADAYPPTFNGLELCGNPNGASATCEEIRRGDADGYVLRLFANPEN